MRLLVNGRRLGAELGRWVIVCDDGRELRRADVLDGKVRLLEATAEEWEQLRQRGYGALWARPVGNT
jgi:hypothetical protein